MTNHIEDAAALLLQSRRTSKRIKDLGRAAPRDFAEAYDMQRAVIAALGATIAGYKISVFPDGETMVAPILTHLVQATGATCSLAPAQSIGIELEFGFRFTKAVPAAAEPAVVMAAIGETVVSLELCETRYERLDGLSRETLAADLISNRGAVLGQTRPFNARDPFKSVVCRQKLDGALNTERAASHPNGDPLLPLALIPKALLAAGYTITPGQFVITGSLTGLTWVEAPLSVVGEIDGFGSVSINLVA
jgi:2-keto-4-pentenoate hydratase